MGQVEATGPVKYALVDLAASGELVAAVSATRLRVLGGVLVGGAAGCTFKVQSKPATAAAVDLTGTMILGSNGVLPLAFSPAGHFESLPTWEQQTVEISGTPTGGSYTLSWTRPDGKSYTTTALAYNASGAAVQAALRAIPGLGRVTVSTAGSTPDFTHTITFVGVSGNPAELTSTNSLTGGSSPSIAHATTVEAEAQAALYAALTAGALDGWIVYQEVR